MILDAPSSAKNLSPVNSALPAAEWEVHRPQIEAIQSLKRVRNAAILAHNYQTPEIYHGIADFHGDSLALARHAATSKADVIVMCGVRFMAETVKLLCPNKTVLLPDLAAGCSLAESISADDVRALRTQYPGVPIVCYVNTSAAVKAECDVACTSGNAVAVVQSLRAPRVILLPDAYLAAYVAQRVGTEIVSWRGRCEVHERFAAKDIEAYRDAADVWVLAHPECPPDVQATADFVGSTAEMVRALRERRPKRAVLLTECTMSDNVAIEFPDIEFMRPCNLCPHMRRIGLSNTLKCLNTLSPAIEVPESIAARARACVERMLAVPG
jgi:quinolinate synthase